jgi:hypothetical protein
MLPAWLARALLSRTEVGYVPKAIGRAGHCVLVPVPRVVFQVILNLLLIQHALLQQSTVELRQIVSKRSGQYTVTHLCMYVCMYVTYGSMLRIEYSSMLCYAFIYVMLRTIACYVTHVMLRIVCYGCYGWYVMYVCSVMNVVYACNYICIYICRW